MTRTHTSRPVWTWQCDRCGGSSQDLSFSQSALPSPEVMRERGWYIAPKYGDLCTFCHNDQKAAEAIDPSTIRDVTPPE